MYMPLMIDVRRAVVFGGERGEGLQKTEKLSVYADELLVVPESVFPAEFILLAAGRLPHVGEELSLGTERRVPVAAEAAAAGNAGRFIEGATFVVSDLRDRSLNETISGLCRARGILCNVIDTKDLCSTWFMSLIDTPHLLAGISSKGGCAYYARQTRIELEEEFRSREPVAEILVDLRDRVPSGVERNEVLDAVYRDGEFSRLRREGRWIEARSRAEALFGGLLAARAAG